MYIKEHPIHALYVVFLHRLGTAFSQSENEEYASLIYNHPSSFLIKYCMVTFVITYDCQSHHCLKDCLLYKGSFEKNTLLPKGNYPFSVDLRPGIN